MKRGFLLALLALAISACAGREEVSLKDTFDFNYRVRNEKGARILTIFSDGERTYFKLFDAPQNLSTLRVLKASGEALQVEALSQNLFSVLGLQESLLVIEGGATSRAERIHVERDLP